MRVDDARHVVAHQGAEDVFALSREAGPGHAAATFWAPFGHHGGGNRGDFLGINGDWGHIGIYHI